MIHQVTSARRTRRARVFRATMAGVTAPARFDSEQPYGEQLHPESGIPLPPREDNPELATALADFADALAELAQLRCDEGGTG